MKKIITLIFLTLLNFSNVFAVTLYDALNQTYQNNIQLNAERENIKASEEDINISKADYKPTLTLSGSKSIENTNKLTNQSGGDASSSDADPLTTSIKLEQTILDYGRDLSFEKNLIGLDLAKAYAYSLGSHRAGVLESSFVAEVKSDLMGEQTILCGVLQTASILLFEK